MDNSISGLKKMAVVGGVMLLVAALFAACSDELPTDPDPDPVIVSSLEPINGGYYKAVMGTSTTDLPVIFQVYDTEFNPMAGQWIKFSREVGDGTLSAESLATNSSGQAQLFYTFDGSLGNAEIRAGISDVDSVTVTLRANTLIPGVGGQAQYVMFSDRYIDTKHYNGEPERVDVDPNYWIVYAVYESSLGVVLVIEDADTNQMASNNEEILGVIVNTVYTGKTADSLGIGSTLDDFRAVYGTPDTIKYDGPALPPIYIRYVSEGLTLYGALSTADTVIQEIHLTDIGASSGGNSDIEFDAAPKTSTLFPAPSAGYRSFNLSLYEPYVDGRGEVFQP